MQTQSDSSKGNARRGIESQKRRKEGAGLLDQPNAILRLKPLRKRRRWIAEHAACDCFNRTYPVGNAESVRANPVDIEVEHECGNAAEYKGAFAPLALMGPVMGRGRGTAVLTAVMLATAVDSRSFLAVLVPIPLRTGPLVRTS